MRREALLVASSKRSAVYFLIRLSDGFVYPLTPSALAPSWLDGSRGKSSEPMPGKEPSAWATAEFSEHLTIIFRHCSRDNEAGGDDALVGNVNKLMVTPPGYTGPPKKGHVIFDACFESVLAIFIISSIWLVYKFNFTHAYGRCFFQGNLGRVDYISEFEFDLFIRPDTCNPRFRVWFNFTVENVRETQQFNLEVLPVHPQLLYMLDRVQQNGTEH
ncbi:cytosolic carboxypeptidase 6-like protein [Labeo rohita]|uniref:Cytosolic carboxypeptidase 6-like protein n=1 Tax=Labeo rohita TaxID=84645 RepID=A0A498NSP7_LABRO|nr:cytosolic carboxypeptidase 6-like protein [Labeo rohita]